MSWSGFKKNVGRATTQVMMKTGHVEKTSDREYEVEERRYRTLESAALRLQKEAKGYLDSLRAMTASQMRIAETIDAFYGDSGASDGVSRSYKTAVEDLDAETVKALDGPYRCVSTEYPDLWEETWEYDEGRYEHEHLEDIEAELNFQADNRRNYTRGFHAWDGGVKEALMLIENVYRTTVLEPINRFCAYFPDINECIKKRNHKMLDYDAMRSKVKKLTEKPDKDPGKLPRTEKEAEMVTAPHFLRESIDMAPSDLHIPSPTKVFDGLKHTSKWLSGVQDPEDAVLESVRLQRGSSRRLDRIKTVLSHSIEGLSPMLNSGEYASPDSGSEDEPLLQRGTSLRRPTRKQSKTSWALFAKPQHLTSSAATIDTARSSSIDSLDTEQKSHNSDVSEHNKMQPRDELGAFRRLHHPRGLPRALSSPGFGSTPDTMLGSSSGTTKMVFNEHKSKSALIQHQSHSPPGGQVGSNCPPLPTSLSAYHPTPFFHPSELEDIMRPLKLEYAEKLTNKCVQAKAAYDQLNDQLTSELPQLIDLRVPYLDPSFEALVKIQLRFCAEAYSRMAQVQQYLDASTRDQYASGDLDARVEDVLGQIRELSIAGTV